MAMRNTHLVADLADIYGRQAEEYALVLDPTLKPIAEHLLRIARVSAQAHLLDLATGTGALAREAASAGAWVVGVDVSPGMLVTAHRRSPSRVSFLMADALALPVAASSFDLVTCSLSLSHFVDVLTVLQEVYRVLRPGGRFIASCWGSAQRDPSFSAALDVVGKLVGTTNNRLPPRIDEKTWSQPERSCKILSQAGFAPVRVATHPLFGTYPSSAAALEWTLAWPLIAKRVEQLGPADRAILQATALSTIKAVNNLTWEREVHYYKATKPMEKSSNDAAS